jgi:hypothetical protein
MKINITEIFCLVDDFCKYISKELCKKAIKSGEKVRKPTRIPGLTDSEIITTMLLFHKSPSKNFKYFYKSFFQLYRPEFPNQPVYERFVTLKQRTLPLMTLLLHCLFVREDKVAFMDSTPLTVCDIKRARGHRVLKGLAAKGKASNCTRLSIEKAIS